MSARVGNLALVTAELVGAAAPVGSAMDVGRAVPMAAAVPVAVAVAALCCRARRLAPALAPGKASIAAGGAGGEAAERPCHPSH